MGWCGLAVAYVKGPSSTLTFSILSELSYQLYQHDYLGGTSAELVSGLVYCTNYITLICVFQIIETKKCSGGEFVG